MKNSLSSYFKNKSTWRIIFYWLDTNFLKDHSKSCHLHCHSNCKMWGQYPCPNLEPKYQGISTTSSKIAPKHTLTNIGKWPHIWKIILCWVIITKEPWSYKQHGWRRSSMCSFSVLHRIHATHFQKETCALYVLCLYKLCLGGILSSQLRLLVLWSELGEHIWKLTLFFAVGEYHFLPIWQLLEWSP